MFRRRESQQKPDEGLYNDFRACFARRRRQIAPPATFSPSPPALPAPTDADQSPGRTKMHYYDGQYGEQDDSTSGQDNNAARSSSSDWHALPASTDPLFGAFTNHHNLFTPTPDPGSDYASMPNPSYSVSVGGLGTPLSANAPAGVPLNMHHHAFQLHDHHYAADAASYGHMPQMDNFFTHPSTYEPGYHFGNAGDPRIENFDPRTVHQTMGDSSLVPDMNQHFNALEPHDFEQAVASPRVKQPQEQFRFKVLVKNAGTAMVKHADEIPITYLNKSQRYSINIKDTLTPRDAPAGVRYRTYIRVSFDDEQQRARPGPCWQLWKEGRGVNEAHHRGGKLQAVEFVEPSTFGGNEDQPSNIELQSSTFDGFSVFWTPNEDRRAECTISVRFNFLSTDFSHSKGVKGIPVRLCAKTEVLDTQAAMSPPSLVKEICYCKVKLFRDHGAERKLSNDIAHVNKTIEKLKQQIEQAKSGVKESGKRRRSDSGSGPRPHKMLKRADTVGSETSGSNEGRDQTDDGSLETKLRVLEEMKKSHKPQSLLFLRGAEQDDPDIFPVQLQGSTTTLDPSNAVPSLDRNSTQNTSKSSRSPSSKFSRSPSRRDSGLQPYPTPSRAASNEWPQSKQTPRSDARPSNPQLLESPSEGPTRIQKSRAGPGGSTVEWVEALGVDHAYISPPERTIKPIACFLIRSKTPRQHTRNTLYRALYLMNRTIKDFVAAAATKSGIDPLMVTSVVRIDANGLNIELSDQDIHEMPERQDMLADFDLAQPPSTKTLPQLKLEGSSDPEPVKTALYTLTLHF